MVESNPSIKVLVDTDSGRFFDGGLLNEGGARPDLPDRKSPLRITLDRAAKGNKESFTLFRRIAYDDRELGVLLVPKHGSGFTTDLTSVPALFTWLVPKTGRHLPATLLHDGLVMGKGEPETYSWGDEDQAQPEHSAHPPVTRVQADRILRDAMADAGTRFIRRWLIWSAVTLGTMVGGVNTGWKPGVRQYKFALGVLTPLFTAYLGLCATLDLFDVQPGWAARIPVIGGWIGNLPWMGEKPFWAELLDGVAGAIAIPVLISVLWWGQYVACIVVGVSLAVLLPVILPVAVVAGLYQLLELVANLKILAVRAVLGVIAAAIVVVAFVIFIPLLS